MSVFGYRLDPEDLGVFERLLAASLKAEATSALETARRRGMAYLRMSSQSIRDMGRFQRGWDSTVERMQLTFFNREPHSFFVEVGRRAGSRLPPISVIADWAERRGLPRGAAFPIARKIAARGIQPRPVLTDPNVQQRLLTFVNDEMQKAWSRASWRAMGR